MEINGLPLHPLVVHAAVVFGPLAGIAGVLYAAVPPWREWLRWPLVGLALVAVGSVWVSYLSGGDLRDARFASATGPLVERLDTHEDRADQLRVIATVFAVLAVLTAGAHHRRGALQMGLVALMGIAGLATVVWSVLTGDAGARATWGA